MIFERVKLDICFIQRASRRCMGVVVLTGAMLLLQTSLSFAADSPTFHIRHVISGYDLTPDFSGTRDDKRNVSAFPLVSGIKSYRWFFDPVADSEYFYIHNLETGLVLTENTNDRDVSNWNRVEGEHAQHWRINSSAADGSILIINRASDRGLIQSHGGTMPDKVNVEAFENYENVTGAFIAQGHYPVIL
jgi:hypothetical protein